MIAAIYVRKSTDQTAVADEQKSVTRQIEHARAYAVRKGWRVAEEHIYVDDGVSGAEFTNRPGFVRLMNALKPRPSFQGLVMSEVSRLGREQIETAYALKQLSVAGVRCFSYLEDRELLLESATDKFLLGAVTFAADLEREKARQRTYDAMLRKARAGHVTGGTVFGYQNIEVHDSVGRRAHVMRKIDDDQAAVVREIFKLYAAGAGVRTIAKRLNDAGRMCPRAQQGRPHGWASSSVWEALHRPIYRGEIVWNQTRKRNQWGAQAQTARAEADWIRIPAPDLRIVPEPLWQDAQARAAAARAHYLQATGGAKWGRPVDGSESRYLLTGFLRCARCGGGLGVRSRSHGQRRAYLYACTSFHHRGRAVCTNSLETRIEAAHETILDDIERFVLHPQVVARAIDLAVEELRPSSGRADRERTRIDKDLRRVQAEVGYLTRAIAAGGDLPSLVTALQQGERQRQALDAERVALGQTATVTTKSVSDLTRQVQDKLANWRRMLRDVPAEARQVLREVVTDRITLDPVERDGQRVYAYRGEYTFGGLFSGTICSHALASPRGTVRLWTIEREGLIAA